MFRRVTNHAGSFSVLPLQDLNHPCFLKQWVYKSSAFLQGKGRVPKSNRKYRPMFNKYKIKNKKRKVKVGNRPKLLTLTKLGFFFTHLRNKPMGTVVDFLNGKGKSHHS